MELDKKHIGKKAILIKEFSGLDVGTTVILRDTVGWYSCEILDVKWIKGAYKHSFHNCGGLFTSNIGYNISESYLELIEEETEETISYDLNNPFGGMEKFK